MNIQLKALAIASSLVAGLAAAPTVYAHGTGDSQGSMMGQGKMGSGMMGQGGMMGHGDMMGSGMMDHGGMMGSGMMGHGGMMGSGMMGHGKKGHDFGGRVVPIKHLSIDDVRHFLEHRLARRGNKRLKVGEVKEQDENVIIADIVTVDDSLVERLKVDRHAGRIERVE